MKIENCKKQIEDNEAKIVEMQSKGSLSIADQMCINLYKSNINSLNRSIELIVETQINNRKTKESEESN